MPFTRFTVYQIVVCLLAATVAMQSTAEAQRGRSGQSDNEKVSFTNDVVPIINAKCGNCHVASSKGRYNVKSYEALMDSDSITPRKPDDSYFIEVIENGDMPKGGLKIEDSELATLRQWIAEGATFDGDDESKAINTGSRNSRSSRGSQSRSRTSGRRPSRSRTSRSSKPNAIKTNKLMAFLDLDGDGKLSLKEIDAASRILRSLDTNGDDRVTGNELEEFGDR